MGFFGELKQDLSQVADEESKKESAAKEADKILSEAEFVAMDEMAAAEESYDNGDDVAALLKDLVSGLGGEELDSPAGSEGDSFDVSEDLNSILAGLMNNEDGQVSFDGTEKAEAPAEEEAPAEAEAPAEEEAPAEAEAPVEEEAVPEVSVPAFTGADEMDEVKFSDETSVISGGMVINGNVEAVGSLEVVGKIIGNVRVKGKLKVSGTITGDSEAKEIFAEGAKITGNVTSESSVKIGTGTVIVGNVSGFSAAIAGAVKGDIDVHGPVILDTTAIVKGNIRSKTVQINNGAALEGICSQAYAEVSPTSFFDAYKA